MKKSSLLLLSSLVLIPCIAAADPHPIYLTLGNGVKGEVNGVAAGEIWVPGPAGTVGTAYSSLTFTDVNEDNVPDLMTLVRSTIHGAATPTSFLVTGTEDDGTPIGPFELDDASIYQVTFPGSDAVQNGHGGLGITIIGPLPLQGSLPDGIIHRDLAQRNFTADCSIANIGTFDPTELGFSAIQVTFPPATGSSSTGVVSQPPPVFEQIAMNEPQWVPPVYSAFEGWMNSTIRNNGDVRQVAIQYTTPTGNAWTLTLEVQLLGNHKDVVQATSGAVKKGGHQTHSQGGIVTMDDWLSP